MKSFRLHSNWRKSKGYVIGISDFRGQKDLF